MKLQSLKFLVMSYGILLLAGMSQFLIIIVLEKHLSLSLYSKYTLVFSFFPIYQIILDLGLQGEIIKRLQTGINKSAELRRMMRLRLRVSVVAVVFALAHCFFAGLGTTAIVGVVVLCLSFIPFSILMNLEIIGYSERKWYLATCSRFGKLLGSIVFISIFSTAKSKQAPMTLFYGLLGVLLTYSVLAAVLYWVNRADFKASWERKLGIPNLLAGSYGIIVNFAVWWLYYSLFSVSNIRIFGDDGLAIFNTAYILTTPVALGVQLGLNFSLTIKNDLRKKIPLLWGMSVIGTIFYGLILSIDSFFGIFFKNIDHSMVMHCLWPLILAHLVLAISQRQAILLQSTSFKNSVAFAPLIAVFTVGAAVIYSLVYTMPYYGMSYVFLIASLSYFVFIYSKWLKYTQYLSFPYFRC